jgi:hypothetical protein
LFEYQQPSISLPQKVPPRVRTSRILQQMTKPIPSTSSSSQSDWRKDIAIPRWAWIGVGVVTVIGGVVTIRWVQARRENKRRVERAKFLLLEARNGA